MRRMRAATDRPIWIKANAGLPRLVNGKTVYQTTPETFAGFVPSCSKPGRVSLRLLRDHAGIHRAVRRFFGTCVAKK